MERIHADLCYNGQKNGYEDDDGRGSLHECSDEQKQKVDQREDDNGIAGKGEHGGSHSLWNSLCSEDPAEDRRGGDD